MSFKIYPVSLFSVLNVRNTTMAVLINVLLSLLASMSVSSGLVLGISSHGSHFLAPLHAWLFLVVCWAFLYL